MKLPNFPICVSIVALIISLMSLVVSYQNREYDHLVAFEQKKQAVRQLSLEADLLSEKVEKKLLEQLKTDKTPDLREKSAKTWKKATDMNKEMKSLAKQFEALPVTSGTQARLELENLFFRITEINKRLREILEITDIILDANHKN